MINHLELVKPQEQGKGKLRSPHGRPAAARAAELTGSVAAAAALVITTMAVAATSSRRCLPCLDIVSSKHFTRFCHTSQYSDPSACTHSPHWTGNAARRHIIPSATVASNASETVGLLYLFATLLMMLLDPLGAGTVRCHCRFTQQCLDPGSRLARSPTSTRSILRRQARKIKSKVYISNYGHV